MFSKLRDKFMSPDLSFKAKIFCLLALTGFIVSLSIFIASLIYGSSALNSAVLLSSAVLSGVLLIFSLVTGKYIICYIITIVFIFMILFPIMFFTAGGYTSGMPAFFVFSVTFTLYMLDGVLGVSFAVVELLIYVACCIIAYQYPALVTPFEDEEAMMTDVIIGFCVSAAALSSTFFFQLRMYAKQQHKLESAINEATKSNKAKGIFLANMSHEIRTPINVILGTNELINRSSDLDEIHEYTSSIKSSGNHLLSIINNILDVTQIESGRIITTSKPYRTDSLLAELVTMGTELCSRKGLKFITDISPDMMSMLEGDKNHLRQIITNFISNAVKYTSKGSITLFAKTVPNSDVEALMTISVTDTGSGIPEKELNHLFEVFGRGKNAIEASIDGTGLGLAIAKDLADSIGAKIIVNTEENVGSTFGIEIIQKICDSYPIGEFTTTPKDITVADSFIAPTCRILAVDDNADNLNVIKLLLERTMITVDTAMDGVSAAEKAAKNDYDLIFLDYMMPNVDGIATLKMMRENGLPDSIPVIALTAEALAGSEDKFLAAGFTSYLSKPVSWHDLEKTLLAQLPEEKLTISTVFDDTLSKEELNELSLELEKYDINLESGISYLSGNLTRFAELAEIFAEGYDHNHVKIERMFIQRDPALPFEIHSLKSIAKGVGAINLFEISRELEKRSKDGDMAYVIKASDLLLFEWKRAADGMKYLVSAVNENWENDNDEDLDSDDLIQKIELGLKEHNWLDTQNALNKLLEIESDLELKKKLKYVYEFVDELDFASADSLFRQFRREKE